MVTNLKHKSLDVKRAYRTAYKRACKPIMERLDCTKMQCATLVEQTLRENDSLRELLKSREHQLGEEMKTRRTLEEQVANLKADLELLNQAAIASD